MNLQCVYVWGRNLKEPQGLPGALPDKFQFLYTVEWDLVPVQGAFCYYDET